MVIAPRSWRQVLLAGDMVHLFALFVDLGRVRIMIVPCYLDHFLT